MATTSENAMHQPTGVLAYHFSSMLTRLLPLRFLVFGRAPSFPFLLRLIMLSLVVVQLYQFLLFDLLLTCKYTNMMDDMF